MISRAVWELDFSIWEEFHDSETSSILKWKEKVIRIFLDLKSRKQIFGWSKYFILTKLKCFILVSTFLLYFGIQDKNILKQNSFKMENQKCSVWKRLQWYVSTLLKCFFQFSFQNKFSSEAPLFHRMFYFWLTGIFWWKNILSECPTSSDYFLYLNLRKNECLYPKSTPIQVFLKLNVIFLN